MLSLEIKNRYGTIERADYIVHVKVNHITIKRTLITEHVREDGWLVLLERAVAQLRAERNEHDKK